MNKTNAARGVVKPTAGRITNAASGSWDSTLAAFAPLADAAKQGAARAAKLDSKKLDSKKRNKKDDSKTNDKGPRMLSLTTTTMTETEPSSNTGMYALLATGVVVGAAGALVARRRTRAKWAEYEPGSLHSDASSFMDAGATSAKSFGETASDMTGESGGTVSKATSKATTWTKGHAKSAVDTVRTKIHKATADPGDMAIEDSAEMAAEKASEKASEKVNEGTGRMSGKAEAKHNAASHSGGSATNTSAASSRGNPMGDEVDDLIRSAKNGRM